MIIGSFQSCDDGYVGRVQTLGLDAEISVVRAEPSETEGTPDWHIFPGNVEDGVEIGVGRTDIGSLGLAIAIEIDDLALGVPLHANLVCDTFRKGPLRLRWSRSDAVRQP
jgi:uncharacterized protein (DUF736 family)